MEQLQTIEKEVRALDTAQKELGDMRDALDRKKGERAELLMRREVRVVSSRVLLLLTRWGGTVEGAQTVLERTGEVGARPTPCRGQAFGEPADD